MPTDRLERSFECAVGFVDNEPCETDQINQTFLSLFSRFKKPQKYFLRKPSPSPTKRLMVRSSR
jgi:hypothetical protein